MIDFTHFFTNLGNECSKSLADKSSSRVEQIMRERPHGDLAGWLEAVRDLPEIEPSQINLNASRIAIGSKLDCGDVVRDELADKLMAFHPWRKGPFGVFGIDIDTEWRSDLKWDRLKDHIAPLKGRLVLDVGCGNGYFCYRMIGAGAKAVVGIDPYMLFVMQYQALNKYIGCDRATVLPLTLEDMPEVGGCFDTVFSMGVLYHRRDVIAHLKDIGNLLTDGGEVILETLVLDKAGEELLVPEGRYAKMRNVWNIPSPSLLTRWMNEAGFANARAINVTKTTVIEQKSTEWMRYESLAEYLDKDNSSLTIESHPAPVRAIVIAEKK